MSGDEDDYLSDKFLIDANSSAPTPKTYAQNRREAERKAKLKNDENRLKNRRQREVEAREEGLSKSLFERAKEEEDAGISSGNKALSMMMKMGFKPGQSLGKVDENTSSALPKPSDKYHTEDRPEEKNTAVTNTKSLNIEPLPLNEWAGKKGIGLGKRTRSPTLPERVAKMAKMAEETSQRDYRDRTRQEYEERRAEGKLGPAQRTCAALDETSGKPFNVLWLNLSNPESFPAGLADALAMRGHPRLFHEKPVDTVQVRLRRQMQADALEPLDGPQRSPVATPLETFSSEQIEEVTQFLRLQAQDRLHLVLSYLRDSYNYCFWCGVQYENEEVMEEQCPGLDEESHD